MNQLRERLNDNETEESNLVKHARRELRLAGMFDEDADFGPEFAEHVVGVIAKISEGGHSGGSMELLRGLLDELLQFRPLTPISSDPEEWKLRSKEESRMEIDFWQNTRDSAAFSTNGGATWYLVDGRGPKLGDHIYHRDTGEYLGVCEGPAVSDGSIVIMCYGWGKPLYRSTILSRVVAIGPEPTK